MFHRGLRQPRQSCDGRRPGPPTVITSVTLMEINSVGTVINVNDRYTNVDLRSGSSFDLESISRRLERGTDIDERADHVPTTAVLFMVGRNDHEEDREVIATFVWIFSPFPPPAASETPRASLKCQILTTTPAKETSL